MLPVWLTPSFNTNKSLKTIDTMYVCILDVSEEFLDCIEHSNFESREIPTKIHLDLEQKPPSNQETRKKFQFYKFQDDFMGIIEPLQQNRKVVEGFPLLPLDQISHFESNLLNQSHQELLVLVETLGESNEDVILGQVRVQDN